MSNIFRAIKYSVQHVTRNLWQSLMVIIVMTMTFVIAQLFVVVGIAGNQLLGYFEDQPQVTVFFKNEALEDQITQIKKELEKDAQVKEVRYISKEQAVEIYKVQHADDPELLEFVTPDILPASLEISVNEIRSLSTIAKQFEDNEFVERVIYQQDLVDELMAWVQAIRVAGVVLLGVMLFVATVIIVLVVGNNVTKFGNEIEVMRYVGAGSWYVRLPFILDGIAFAFIAGCVASVVMYFLLPNIQAAFSGLILAIELFPNQMSTVFLLWVPTVALGSAFTAIVSYLSVWKHLRV